ncbi:MAG: hypothetical protein HKN04_04045, partial [Rhodothermaceae bacterium]|nr:hypothetical protein [Rhodothermaceae bacterium]
MTPFASFRRSLLLVVLLLAGSVQAQSLLAEFEPSVTTFTLDNGLSFI